MTGTHKLINWLCPVNLFRERDLGGNLRWLEIRFFSLVALLYFGDGFDKPTLRALAFHEQCVVGLCVTRC